MTKQRLLETSENPDSSTISAEQIRRAARTSTYVFLLHLRSLENAKNVERERERDRWDTLSVFTIEPRRLPGDHCVSSRVLLFPSTVSLNFFSFAHRFTFWFLLACFHSFQEVEVDKFDRANSMSPIAWFSFDRMHFTRKRRAMCHWYNWCGCSIKAALRLAEILMIEFNVAEKLRNSSSAIRNGNYGRKK